MFVTIGCGGVCYWFLLETLRAGEVLAHVEEMGVWNTTSTYIAWTNLVSSIQ